MEWAIPPKPIDWVRPTIHSRKALGNAFTRAWDIWERSEGFQNTPAPPSFQLTTLNEDSTSILPLQLAVQRFLTRIYVPSSTFLASEANLPEVVKTILAYYDNYLTKRQVGTYDPTKQWSLKYTGETQNLGQLPPSTNWDNAYKYYRWNFANPTECIKQGSGMTATDDVPAFDFAFQTLGQPVIYTHKKAVEGFQVSTVNTLQQRIQPVNQKFRNGVLMVRFDTPVQWDGYSWSTGTPTGWTLQGSNDESVWSEELDASAYMDAMKENSSKWDIMHKVASNTQTAFANKSRASMTRQLKVATLAMVSQYIEYIRKTYVSLPANMQSTIMDCYKDVERDMTDAKNPDLNEKQIDVLVEKYIFDGKDVGDIETIETVDLQTVIAAARLSPNDSTKFASLKVASDLPLVPGMKIEVFQTAGLTKAFDAFIYSYSRTAGDITLFRMQNFRDIPSGRQGYTLRAFFYTTQTTEFVSIRPIPDSSLTLKVGQSLSYEAGNNVKVASGTNGFEATVGSYDKATGNLELNSIRNIVGEFRNPAIYAVEPLQKACVARLRENMRTDIVANIDKIFTLAQSCTQSNTDPLLEVAVTPAGGVVIRIKKETAGQYTVVKTIALDKAADNQLLRENASNVSIVQAIYNKYNDAFNYLVKRRLMGEEVTVPESVETAVTKGLFEEPNSLTVGTALPDILLRQIQRMINEKMRHVYDLYYFTTDISGTVVRVTPVNYTQFYEPALRAHFTVDPVSGKSKIAEDYEKVWKTTFNVREEVEGNILSGKEILIAMNAKYDAIIASLKENKKIAEKRQRTIQMMEVFEEFYGMLSSVLTTMSIQLPAKATRDNERLFVAANSNNPEELDALYNRYVDYMYTSQVMRGYKQVPNDLWSCASDALKELIASVRRLYETRDPTPEGMDVLLSSWKRTENTDNKTYFEELEDQYNLQRDMRPSVIYPTIQLPRTQTDRQTQSTLETELGTIISAIRSRNVFKKPQAGDSTVAKTKQNLDNYNLIVGNIQDLQNNYIRLYNAREILEPSREANKAMGLLKRTREAMQLDRTKVRVRTLVQAYKALYEQYVSDPIWSQAFEPTVGNPENSAEYTYIVNVWKGTELSPQYNVVRSEASSIRDALATMLPSGTIVQCAKQDIQDLVNSNISWCSYGWVSDVSDSPVYPSKKGTLNECGGGNYSDVTLDTNETKRQICTIYFKVTTNSILPFLTKVKERGLYTVAFVSETMANRSNDLPNNPALNYTPWTAYNLYKIVQPTIPAKDYEKDLIDIDNAIVGSGDIAIVNNTILDIETRYTGTSEGEYNGHILKLLNYVGSIGIQLFDQINAMYNAYKDLIPPVYSTSGIIEATMAADRTIYADLSGNVSFLNDTTRAAVLGKMNTLLNKTTTFNTSPTIRQAYATAYINTFKWVFYYEYQLMMTKRKIGRIFVEHLRLCDVLKTVSPEGGRLIDLNSTATPWPTIKSRTTDNPLGVTTLAEAKSRLGSMAASSSGWIDSLMTAVHGAFVINTDSFFTRSKTFYDTCKNKKWFMFDELSSIKSELQSVFEGKSTFPDLSSVTWGLTVQETPTDLLNKKESTVFITLKNVVLPAFAKYYALMKRFESAINSLRNKPIWREYDWKTKPTVASSTSNVPVEIDVLDNDLEEYDTMHYILVGGGGGGGKGIHGAYGGGGGSSGFFMSSMSSDELPADIKTTNAIHYDTVTFVIKDIPKTTSADSYVDVSNISSIKVSIGRGGTGADNNKESGEDGKSTYIKLNNDIQVVANGGEGGRGSTPLPPRGGLKELSDPLYANRGGNGTGNNSSRQDGESKYGGVGGGGYPSGGREDPYDNAGGGGGGGIGFGKGGEGSNSGGSGGNGGETPYSGAGGGGGSLRDGNGKNGTAGASGYAILRFTKRNNTTRLNFLRDYTVSQGFQNQHPCPQDIQRKLAAQKLNALQFNPQPKPTFLQSLFSWF